MNDLKIIQTENHKFLVKNRRKGPSNDLALSNGSNSILPLISSYDQNNSKSLSNRLLIEEDYWSNKLNNSKIKDVNQYGEISPPKKHKPVSTSAMKNLQDNSMLLSRNIGSSSPFNFPKIKILNNKKNSRNLKDIKAYTKKESKEDSVNLSNNEENKKIIDNKENQYFYNNIDV
jgi:hypothetical protein